MVNNMHGDRARGQLLHVTAAESAQALSDPSVSDKQPDDKNDQKQPANSAPHSGTAVVVAATAARDKQQNQ